jgi:hypothetical protein
VTSVPREVALEELMPNDPLIEGSDRLDLEPELLLPGAPLITEDDVPPQGERASEVITYEVFENRFVLGEHAPGPLLTTMVTAQIISGNVCPDPFLPQITLQPEATGGILDGRAEFAVAATDPSGSTEGIVYEWRHNGVAIPDSDSDVFSIDPLTAADEGFYECAVTSICGTTFTMPAYLTVTDPCRIISQPVSAFGCGSSVSTFTVEAAALGSKAHVWEVYDPREPSGWADLNEGDVTVPAGRVSVTGTQTDTLTVTPLVTSAANFAFRCRVESNCEDMFSEFAQLWVCPADYNCDGGVDGDDVISFFGHWDAGMIAADFNHDGGVDGDDVIEFFSRWDSGC